MTEQLSLGVIGLIEKDSRVLLGRKIIKEGHPLSDQWHVPGGGVDKDESPEQALIREMKEETGLDVEIVRYMDAMKHTNLPIKLLWYLCRPVGGVMKAGDDLSKVGYYAKADAVQMCQPRATETWPPKVREYLGYK